MIILDTNVVSELIRPGGADQSVVAWLDSADRTRLATTSLTYAETLYGIAKLEDGHRRRSLTTAINRIYDTLFEGRILPFDAAAAREHAGLLIQRRLQGRPILQFDAQIAAIARAHGYQLATRDADFADCGIDVINPWEYGVP